MSRPTGDSFTKPEELRASRAWFTDHLSNDPGAIPISFAIGDRAIRGLPASWRPKAVTRRIDANISETVIDARDPDSGLIVRVESTKYHDYPVAEWLAWFTNDGSTSSPVLRDILALDDAFPGAGARLVHTSGDTQSPEGFLRRESAISSGEDLTFAGRGGWPSDVAFPYYRLKFEGSGVTLAIGWPGQWSATFRGSADGVAVRAGQELTNLRLEPGETIRTPRITALFWTGDEARAVNLWRRWYTAHILPRPDGQPLPPKLVGGAPGDADEWTAATVENQFQGLDLFEQRGIKPDIWWIDAGWYPCVADDGTRKWQVTGSWQPDSERFPDGFAAISQRAAARGADLLVWFEPERVRPGTELDRDHPEWLLRVPDKENRLLNLGDTACREWLTERVCQLIADNGIKVYRQDHNFLPLDYWRGNEPEDRQGMNENLHVQGYLQFWDDILARNPGLWIDACAAGGRRNDLETMRRSVPLHYSDHGYGIHPVKLAFEDTLHNWIPYFKESTLSWDLEPPGRSSERVDRYSFHCALAPMMALSIDVRRDDHDYPLVREMIDVWRRASEALILGDYYALSTIDRSGQGWCLRQFDRPELGTGFVQGIRFPASSEDSMTVPLHGLRAELTYDVENAETHEVLRRSGDDLLRSGLTFSLPPRSGEIWIYRSVGADPQSVD